MAQETTGLVLELGFYIHIVNMFSLALHKSNPLYISTLSSHTKWFKSISKDIGV